MFFDRKAPSHHLAWRALAWHMLPAAIFAAGFICDPSFTLWSSAEGRIALTLIQSLLLLCTILSGQALHKAWGEGEAGIKRRAIVFPLFIADVMLTLFVFFILHRGG
jgi:hypothetical protein